MVVSKVINRVLIVLLVWMVLWIELWIGWEMRKRLRGLYPNQNPRLCDNILTDALIPVIHITVYLILVF